MNVPREMSDVCPTCGCQAHPALVPIAEVSSVYLLKGYGYGVVFEADPGLEVGFVLEQDGREWVVEGVEKFHTTVERRTVAFLLSGPGAPKPGRVALRRHK